MAETETPSPDEPKPPGGSRAREVGSAAGGAARVAGPDVAKGASSVWSFFLTRIFPRLRALFGRIGEWLAPGGWGKFPLVAILLMSVFGIASTILYDEGPPVVVIDARKPKGAQDKAAVRAATEGIRI